MLREVACEDVDIDVEDEQLSSGDLALVIVEVEQFSRGDLALAVVDVEQFIRGDLALEVVVETTTGEVVVVVVMNPFGVQSLE